MWKSMLLGNLGGDAEVRLTSSQTPVCSFSLAVPIGYGEKKSTQWVRCNIWGKRAEGQLPGLLKKGTRVFVIGDTEDRKWEDKSGNEKNTIEIRVDELQFAGSKKEGGDDSSAPRKQSSGSQKSLLEDPPAGSTQPIPFDDDDVPF